MKYKWKHIAPAKISADVIGKEIEQIIKECDGVTAELLVDYAKAKKSPLHTCFEWNDSVAAKMYRETQARYILRQIECIIETEGDGEPIHIRAFHNVITEDERIYTTLTSARNDPDLWEQVKNNALLEIKKWQETYQSIKEFEAIFIAIGQIT